MNINRKVNKPSKNLISCIFIGVFLSACATTSEEKNSVGTSYLNNASDLLESGKDLNHDVQPDNPTRTNIEQIEPLPRTNVEIASASLSRGFSDQDELSVSVNEMSVKSFLHYVFGEMLNVDYIIGNKLKKSPISLNITSKISSKRLFELSEKILTERHIGIQKKSGMYYFYQIPKGKKGEVVLGFGRDTDLVPQNAGQILQVVPLKYGIRISVERTLRGLIDAQITADFEQGALFIQGRRDQIVRAIDLIKLLDVPSNRGKYISLISPVYMSTITFTETVTELLKTEGVDIGKSPDKKENLVFIPLPQIGAVAVFSSEKTLIARVEYWAEKIDKPSKGDERQYHVYTPKFARASDLGDSIAPLISSSYASSKSNSAKADKDSSLIANNTKSNSVSNESMSMVVDKRSNTLIFHTSGSEYQALLPLIKRMDIMPKQVLLSVTIAEVNLQGIFKRGFEFAISSGNFGASTQGAFGIDDITGMSLSWASGANEVLAKFVEENSYVNILSKPSILVRDGTEATINVGDKVPVSSGSSTGSNGDVITENISYRETGIKLNVSPTINAQGVVIMKIVQDISNQVADQVGKGGNPLFFERNVTTEVVADSGQTILLGGLISEDKSNSDKGVPFLKSIPLLGALFESESKTTKKTELVILVTPKIVERSAQWKGILNSFQNVLQNIHIN